MKNITHLHYCIHKLIKHGVKKESKCLALCLVSFYRNCDSFDYFNSTLHIKNICVVSIC